MRRRNFIAVLIGSTAAWPVAAPSQQTPQVRRLGILIGATEDEVYRARLDTFQQGLEKLGWRVGHNLHIELVWGGLDREAVQQHARTMVARAPEVVLAGPGNAVIPLQAETRTIPIVFVQVSDPMGQGVVDSIARPTGNATGFSNLEFSMLGKWMDILKEIAPAVRRVGVMINSVNSALASWYRTLEELAPKAGLVPDPGPVRSRAEVEAFMAKLAQAPDAGLIVPGDTFVETPEVRRQIIALAARLRLPAVYTSPRFVADGGLVAYGIDQLEPYRLAAGYVDRILRGEKPSDLPVQQPTRFKFSLNLKTAKALGLTVPLSLQVAADEVIE